MRLTFKYPVYPTQAEERILEKWLGHLCDLQNSARHDRLVAYETEGTFVSLSDQQTLLRVARETYNDFREVPQDFQNHALRRNDKAFTAFRKRCKENAVKKGYRRYKKRVRSLTWSLRKYTKVVGKKTKDTEKQTIRVRENPIIETDFRHNRLSVGLPTSMKRETRTKHETRETYKTQNSYCFLLQEQVFRLGYIDKSSGQNLHGILYAVAPVFQRAVGSVTPNG